MILSNRLTLAGALALSVVSTGWAQSTPVDQPEKPSVTWVPAYSGNFNRGRRGAIDRVVIHTIQGSVGSAIGTFQNKREGRRKVSAHYIVGFDGKITQMVADADTAWHVYGANRGTIGIEHEGWAGRNRWTQAQYQSSARLTRWLCLTYDIPMDREHIRGHAEMPGQAHRRSDPGRFFDWELYLSLVRQRPPLTAVFPAPDQVLGQRRLSPGLTLRWQPAPEQEAYRVQVEDLDNGKSFDSGNVVGGASHHVLMVPFVDRGHYRWKVHATNGQQVYESPWVAFTADLTGPSLEISSPASGDFVYDGHPEVRWVHADPDAPQAGYRIVIRQSAMGPVVFDTRELNGDTSAYQLPKILQPGNSYVVYVLVHDGRGNVTERSTQFATAPRGPGPPAIDFWRDDEPLLVGPGAGRPPAEDEEELPPEAEGPTADSGLVDLLPGQPQ